VGGFHQVGLSTLLVPLPLAPLVFLLWMPLPILLPNQWYYKVLLGVEVSNKKST